MLLCDQSVNIGWRRETLDNAFVKDILPFVFAEE